MRASSYVPFGLGLLFEFLLIWRIHRQRIWRRYPFFCTYVWFVAGTTLIQFAVLQLSSRFYPIAYWVSDALAFLLRFGIVWEVFNQIFPRGIVTRLIITVGVSVSVACLMTVFLVAGPAESSTLPFLISNLGRQASLVQAAALAWILLGALYYGMPLGRNIWGITVGLGIFVSICGASFAAIHLQHSLLGLWQVVSQLSFVFMLGIWTWALWRHAPNPAVPETPGGRDLHFVLWQKEWGRLWATLQKAFQR